MRFKKISGSYNDLKFSKKLKRDSPFCSSINGKAKKRNIPGNKHIQSTFNNNNSLNGSYKTKKRNSNGFIARLSEPNDDCSIGSCSISSNYVAVNCRETSIISGDAGSCNTCSLFLEKEVVESIHRLELHAYRSTLEALYASGPLSWEKEALLTNLRINLHISNDEHLKEVKHLIS